jgi:GrpB-like predicted nucleotidyltransferase (UPF0157 family)
VCDPFREPVALSDVDPAWPRQYAAAAARIADALAVFGPSIDHIGSTSVPLRGKPIVDIQVAVEASDRAGAIAALEAIGYRHHGQGGVPEREFLTSRPAHGSPVNVHVFAADSPLPADNRLIRDYLRAHPEAARVYARSKDGALEQGHTHLRSYSRAKRASIVAVREAARRWADPA